MEFSFTAPPLLFALEMASAASLMLAAVPLFVLELKAERARLRKAHR